MARARDFLVVTDIDETIDVIDERLEQLRNLPKIEKEYEAAKEKRQGILDKIDALQKELVTANDVLREIGAKLGVASAPVTVKSNARNKAGAAKGENKAKVQNALTNEFQTIAQIETATGLNKTQIPQVLQRLKKKELAENNDKGEWKLTASK